MIDELILRNFRGFGSLELKGLKPVNLIVGHNNTGKTSLLEGIVLLCEPPKVGQLVGLFRPIQGSPKSRFYRWLLKDGSKQAYLKRGSGDSFYEFVLRHPSVKNEDPLPGPGWVHLQNCQDVFIFANTQGPQNSIMRCRIVSVQHMDPNSLVSLIGKAHRKKKGEETLQRLLSKIDPRISKIRIDPGEDGNQVIVDIGLSELLPITQVGQGAYRLASILADIIGEETDVLLIDEIENGLHHSVMEQVWTGLAETAAELKVQIFATTHSGECLLAAHKAFEKRSAYDLAVIQLFRNEKGVQGRVLDKEHIEAAVAADIELR